jgi:hypothetical protein
LCKKISLFFDLAPRLILSSYQFKILNGFIVFSFNFNQSSLNSPLVELSSALVPSVHVTNPGDETVVGTSTFCSVVVVILSVVVRLRGLGEAASVVVVISSSAFVIGENETLILVVDSVIGFLLDVTGVVLFGRFVVLRVTNVVLTVEVFIVGFDVVEGFMLAVELVVFSSDSTEKVVTSISSAQIVVGSTLTMKSVGVGRGRGAFVVSTNEIVDSIAEDVEDDDDVVGVGFLVVVEFLREEMVVLRFTVTFAGATGFLVGFITVDVAFFDVVTGLLVTLTVLASTDVLLSGCCVTGFLVGFVGFVAGFLVR